MFGQNSGISTTWFRLLIIILLVLGVVFRFVNLDKKVYWHDEVFTSLRVAGYTIQEVEEQLFNGREIGVEALQKYQRLTPERNVIDTLESLAVEDPQHPPLYYVILRFWMQGFGSSVAAVRSLTALISLLVFPCVYWLCRELFESSLVGWIAIALIAVSPIHVLFAQDAREYALWTVTILLSSASLLRAMRVNSTLSWGIYAVTLAIGFYSCLFSSLVAIGHGVYVVAIAKFRWSKVVKAYLLSSLVGLLIFALWLLVVVINYSQLYATTKWIYLKIDPLVWIKSWLLNLSRIVWDISPLGGNSRVNLIITILLFCSIYFLCRTSPRRVWLFVLTLIGSTALPLMLPDIIQGGTRSIIPRYLFPCYLGFQLAVAYLLAKKISSASFLQQKIGQLSMAVLLSAGVISCLISSQAETWWIKTNSRNNPQIAHIVNQANRPLVIGNNLGGNRANLISLSYLLDPKVRLQLVQAPNVPQIANKFSDIFFFDESSYEKAYQLLAKLESEKNYKKTPLVLDRNHELEPISKVILWRLHG